MPSGTNFDAVFENLAKTDWQRACAGMTSMSNHFGQCSSCRTLREGHDCFEGFYVKKILYETFKDCSQQ